MIVDPLPLRLKHHKDISRCFNKKLRNIAVNYYIIDPKIKKLVSFGSSRPCGENYHKASIHAEEIAINYCIRNDKRNRFHIYISRFSKEGIHKEKFCCLSCNKLVYKYNFEDRIFTIKNNKIISALEENPEVSLAYKMKLKN